MMRSRLGTILERATTPVALLVLAALLRLAFLLFLGNHIYWADTKEYEATALQFLNGHGPGAGTPRAPLYPLLMALGFKIGGVENYQTVRALQLVFALLLLHLCGLLARRMAGPLAQRLTLLALAVSPTMVFTSCMLYPTVLYSTLLMAITLAAWQLSEQPSFRRAALLGVLITLGWLTDQVIVAPVAAVLAWLVWGVRRKRAPLAGAIAITLAVAALLAVPYLRWQREAYGDKAVFMQKAQYVLFWSRSDSLMSSTRDVRIPRGQAFRALSAREFIAQEAGLLREQPRAYLHDVGFEFLHFLAPMPDRVQTQNQFNRGPVLLLGALYFAPFLLLALIGCFAGPVPLRDRALAMLVVLATAAFYSLFFTQTRYRIPVEPQITLLAALGALRLIPRKWTSS